MVNGKNINGKARILLLDGHTVQAYSASAALKKTGAIVTVFCDSKISYGYASKYPDHKVISPRINGDNSKFIDFLLEYLSKKPQDVIIPLFNDSAELLSKHKEQIELKNVKVAIPGWSMFIRAHNKELLMNICRENNIPHPRTVSLAGGITKEIAEQVGFPALIKPNISAGASGIKYVNNYHEFIEKSGKLHDSKENYTLQEYINHADFYFNVMIYRYEDGSFSEAVIIKIIRYFPIKGGSSSYSNVVDNDELVRICKKTLECIDWHGFADFDIIQDKTTNEYKIIEINPRVPSSLHAAYISGINFPEIIVNDNLNREKPASVFVNGKKLRYLSLDIMWFIFSKNRLRAHPSWFNFFEKNVAFQEGNIRDPLPILAGIAMGIAKYMSRSYRKKKLES
jgi:predicted ATP-grasp superfamily ATP-dependent carboligase